MLFSLVQIVLTVSKNELRALGKNAIKKCNRFTFLNYFRYRTFYNDSEKKPPSFNPKNAIFKNYSNYDTFTSLNVKICLSLPIYLFAKNHPSLSKPVEFLESSTHVLKSEIPNPLVDFDPDVQHQSSNGAFASRTTRDARNDLPGLLSSSEYTYMYNISKRGSSIARGITGVNGELLIIKTDWLEREARCR